MSDRDLDLFGEHDKDGNLVKDADHCILTGRAIETGDPTFAIGRFFYRVKVEALAQHTPEVRAELEKLVPQQNEKPAPAKAGKQADSTTPKEV
jgi:hypothetical protein